MYCKSCGKQNDEDAAYCQKCGRILEAEDETRLAARRVAPVAPADTEAPIFRVGPTLKFVRVGYVLAALGGLALVVLLSMLTTLSIVYAVMIALLLLLIPVYFHIRQKLISYTLTPSSIEIDSGLISRTTRNIPLDRIQDVTVATTVSQRLLGFGDIVIDNASESGGKVIVKNVDSPRSYADILMKQIRRLQK